MPNIPWPKELLMNSYLANGKSGSQFRSLHMSCKYATKIH